MTKNTENSTIEDYKEFFQNSSQTYDDTTWLDAAREKIYSILRSPMKEEYTHEAFKWVSHLCIAFGDFSWITSNKKFTHDEAKMFSCFVLLSFNEIQILMPLIHRHLTHGKEVEVEEGKILTRPASTEEYDRFGDHLVILESFIKTLVHSQDQSENSFKLECLSNKELGSLLDRLKEIAIQLCEYLETVHKNWSILLENRDDEKFSSAEGALRIICVWLSEEPELFKPQCKMFLFNLIIKNLLLDDSSLQPDILILALHSMCTYFSDDDELLTVLKDNSKHKEALEKYLIYVQKEKSTARNDRHSQKKFKLRCGMVKDLMAGCPMLKRL